MELQQKNRAPGAQASLLLLASLLYWCAAKSVLGWDLLQKAGRAAGASKAPGSTLLLFSSLLLFSVLWFFLLVMLLVVVFVLSCPQTRCAVAAMKVARVGTRQVMGREMAAKIRWLAARGIETVGRRTILTWSSCRWLRWFELKLDETTRKGRLLSCSKTQPFFSATLPFLAVRLSLRRLMSQIMVIYHIPLPQ